jgi:hypothetical protein
MNAVAEELKKQFTRELMFAKKSQEEAEKGNRMEAIYWRNQSTMVHNNKVNPLIAVLEGVLSDKEFFDIANEVKLLVG